MDWKKPPTPVYRRDFADSASGVGKAIYITGENSSVFKVDFYEKDTSSKNLASHVLIFYRIIPDNGVIAAFAI